MQQEVIHGLKVHPAASLLPSLNKRDLKELVESIKREGLINKVIVTKDGQILDGRNRARAWKELGYSMKELPTEVYEGEDDSDPALARAVYGYNIARRHLNAKQRVALRLKLLEDLGFEETEEETAKAADAKKSTVQKVKQAKKKNPEKFAKSVAGDTSGRGRPAGRTYPMRITLSCDGDDKMTPSEAARFTVERWHNVPRGYLGKFVEQLTAQWTAFQEKQAEKSNGADEADEDEADEDEVES